LDNTDFLKVQLRLCLFLIKHVMACLGFESSCRPILVKCSDSALKTVATARLSRRRSMHPIAFASELPGDLRRS